MTGQVLHNPEAILGPGSVETCILAPKSEQLLGQPKEDHPLEEGHKVTWIEPVPQSTSEEGVSLGDCLGLFSGLLIDEVGFRVVLLLIDILFKGCLDAHVPAVNFDFETGVQEKLFDFCSLDFVESVPCFTVTDA